MFVPIINIIIIYNNIINSLDIYVSTGTKIFEVNTYIIPNMRLSFETY